MKHLREILAITLPAIVANVTTPLLSIADMAIIGHAGSEVLIGAIALGGTMFSAIYWMFSFLRMGTSGFTAQSYGKGDAKEISLNYNRPMLLAVALGVVLVLISPVVGPQLILFVGDGDEASQFALTYFNILIYSAPATLGMFAMTGFLIGMQNSKAVMWMSILLNVVNVGLTLLLVWSLGLGVKGAAIGTLVSQWMAFIVGYIYVIRRYRLLSMSFREIVIHGHFRRYFSVNANIFLRTLCLVCVTIWFTRSGSRQSVTMLALNAIMMQLFMFFSYFMDGIAYAGEALVGKYIGRSQRNAIRSVVHDLLIIGLVISMIFTGAYFIFGSTYVGLMTDDANVIKVSSDYLPWACVIPVVSFAAFVMDGVFVGATATKYMLIAVASAAIIYFSLWILLFSMYQNHGLWIAFTAYLLMRSVISILLVRKIIGK